MQRIASPVCPECRSEIGHPGGSSSNLNIPGQTITVSDRCESCLAFAVSKPFQGSVRRQDALDEGEAWLANLAALQSMTS